MAIKVTTTDPAQLENLARCFSACVPIGMENCLKSYLLAQYAFQKTCVQPTGGPDNGSTTVTATTLTASWTNGATNANGWLIMWGTSAGASDLGRAVLPMLPTSYTITGLTTGQTVFWTVFGLLNGCEGKFSTSGSGTPSLCPFSAKTCDWANRVVANGDPRPSNAVLQAYDTWYQSLVTNGIDGLMIWNILLNAVPGTIITNTTPFFKTFGSDPANLGPAVAAGDFGVNGFVGVSGSNKYFRTGVVPSAAFPSVNSAGIALYNYADTGTASSYYSGCNDAANANLYECPFFNGGGNGYFFTCFFGAGDFIQWLAPDANNVFQGYISSQRTAANSWNIYGARSTFAHASVGSSANAPGTRTGQEIYVMTKNDNGAPVAGTLGSPNTLSFFAITQGLTSAQDLALFNATQTLLQTIGGGFR